MAKAKTIKIPKTIGGMKVPKDLRKKGNALLEKANSPEGRQVIASGVAMMATAAMAARSQAAKAPAPAGNAKSASGAETTSKDDAAGNASKSGPTKCGEPGTHSTQTLEQMVETIGTAAEAALKRVFGNKSTG